MSVSRPSDLACVAHIALVAKVPDQSNLKILCPKTMI